ncbi:hypothetical protein BS47DRAFT_1365905 [Hydnum rufescens UP504]|uniref:Uncharacterized protein n=1 Tax=Hydnum rufescens UP504 TaxID=1448309 RepID=A0A9P6AMH4_9AGAM|nr:hypothetical protein BS47DRAFT_1365905 [Hydnum rufescens UP504]
MVTHPPDETHENGNPPTPLSDDQPLYQVRTAQPQYQIVPHTHLGFKLKDPKCNPCPALNGEVPSHTPSTTHPLGRDPSQSTRNDDPPQQQPTHPNDPPNGEGHAPSTTHPPKRYHTHLSGWYHTPVGVVNF